MALKKEFVQGTKSGEYWKIIGISPDSTYGRTNVKMALYPTSTARFKDDASYVFSMIFDVAGIQSDKEVIYNKLKRRPEFEDSKDV